MGTARTRNKGIGTGWRGEVATFSLLPAAALHTGETYLVTTNTGSLITFNLRRSGLYQSDGATWTKISPVQFMFKDDQLTFQDDVDNSKQLGFELSGIGTATRPIATWQPTSGTVAYLSDVGQNYFGVNLNEEVHAELTVDQDDYTPTNWATSYIHKISGSSTDLDITGFGALANGTRRLLINNGSFSWELDHNSGNSLAANRIFIANSTSNIEIDPFGTIEIQYFTSDSKWRVLEPSFWVFN